MRIMKAFLLPLALSFGACAGDDEPSVEAWVDGAWTPVAVTAYAIDGKRDGRRTRAVATFTLHDGASLRVQLEVSYDPRPVLSAGHWSYDGAMSGDGTVVERSMKFFGGQAEGPSLGGRFRLDQNNRPRFRIRLPLRPVSQPQWK
jgi:hypothetical protein